MRALPSDTPRAGWRLLVPRRDLHKYSADHRDSLFYFVTNKDAKNYRVMTAPVATPDEAHWTEFLPADPNVKVDDITLFSAYAVVSERFGGLPHLKVIDLKTRESREIEFPEPSYDASLSKNAEYDTPVLRFSYQSPVTALSVFSYDMGTHERTLVKQTQVLGGYSPADYACERVYATASDGTKIPITLTYRRQLRVPGPAEPPPLRVWELRGQHRRYVLVQPPEPARPRGHLRHRPHPGRRGAGRALARRRKDEGHKMTTFTDFIACAEFLQRSGYTSPAKTATSGGSAGGLLMGAVLNLRPDLFKCAVAKVPFVDVVNTMLDASLPLTTEEYTEWGNPNVAEEYGWIRAYSPYDNIRAQAYPAILVTTALNDSQVPYWEGCKFVAKLRATKTDFHPLLLKVNVVPAGHGGASGRYDALHEVAFDDAFILSELQ